MKRRKFKKRSQVMGSTTHRREHHILYDRWIHGGFCIICSKRAGQWVDCWRPNNREYDNPVKSWKYKYKKRRQWMYQKEFQKKNL